MIPLVFICPWNICEIFWKKQDQLILYCLFVFMIFQPKHGILNFSVLFLVKYLEISWSDGWNYYFLLFCLGYEAHEPGSILFIISGDMAIFLQLCSHTTPSKTYSEPNYLWPLVLYAIWKLHLVQNFNPHYLKIIAHLSSLTPSTIEQMPLLYIQLPEKNSQVTLNCSCLSSSLEANTCVFMIIIKTDFGINLIKF